MRLPGVQMSRRWVVLLAAVSLIAMGCKSVGEAAGADPGAPVAAPAPAPVAGFPSSMVALGDSLTAAFGSCLAPSSCPRNSWSTGNGTQVNSHYRRILKENPAIEDRAVNLAVPGATVSDLSDQADAAVKKPAEYITILIGANDACRGDMTAPGTFRTKLDAALATLRKGLPKSQLLLVGIPNVFRVWEIGHTNKLALAVWKTGICPNLLANATSLNDADVARRNAFRDRIGAYNAELKAACTGYGSRCRYDDVATFAFELTMLSASDFFHPNASGQNALAEQTYPGSFTW
jgi:lysophospholipase L1-like esterase